MNWQEILVILVPIFALMGWVYSRIDKKFDLMDKKFDHIDERFDEVVKSLHSLDMRLTRLEGALMSGAIGNPAKPAPMTKNKPTFSHTS